MRLSEKVERTVLAGSLAVRLWDAIKERPCDVPCDVTVLRGADLATVARASVSAGLCRFLNLRPGEYRLLIEPRVPQYLPSLRSVTLAASAPDAPPVPVRLDAPLRPSPAYPVPAHWCTLRGTVEWASTHTRARWAVVYGWLATSTTPDAPIMSSLTRCDENGEFALLLRSSAPNSDGRVANMVAALEIHAAPPQGSLASARIPYGLGLDDGSDAENRIRLPLRRTLSAIAIRPGDDLSVNRETYTTTLPGSSRPVIHKVVQITS